MFAGASREYKTAIVILLHHPSVHELAHETLSSFLVMVLLLHHLDLLLENLVVGQLGCDLLLFDELRLLLVLDLLLRSSSFAACLK